MKILIVSQYYFPEQFQINEIAPELVKRGHEVTVLCGVPNYPKGVVYPGYESEGKRTAQEEECWRQTGVKVIHISQVPRGRNLFTLVANYLSFARNSKKAVHLLPNDFDVVLGYQLSPITSMTAALEYKKLFGTPVLFYTLDIWPASAESVLKSKRNPLMLPVSAISKRTYQGADRILVTSRPFIDYLERVNGVRREDMDYLPQHSDASMLEMNLGEKHQTGCTDFLFAGNMGKAQRLDVIVEAAAILGPRADYKIHFVGDGSMRRTIEQMVHDKGLESNFVFHGNQPRKDMPSFYGFADALLITLRGNNEVGDTMPGKLQMYMTTGKPILGAINGAANEVIRESGCGACVAAGDSVGLAGLMEDFLCHRGKYCECGENARRYFKDNFTLEHYMDCLEKELKQLCHKE